MSAAQRIQTKVAEAVLIRRKDFLMAPLCEAALIAIAGLTGWVLHTPLLFASLGPTAYELIETPERASARPYNVLVGHTIGVAAGIAALWLTGAGVTAVPGPGGVPLARVCAAVIASALTVLVTLLTRAMQPAAIATTLLIALGLMQGWHNVLAIAVAVVLMTAVGEPMRYWRAKERATAKEGPVAV